MNENDISVLLEKYNNGNTSLEEENAIHDYMIHNSSHAQASWFVAKAALQNERSTLSVTTFHQRRNKTLWYNSTGFRIAASLLLVFVATVLIVVNKDGDYVSVGSPHAVKQITLPDGSVVTLNQNAVARYASSFNNTRDFWLDRGEAFFEVTKNPGRPFTVHTGKTTTRVLGTSFNIINNTDLTEVSVLSGKVVFSAIADNAASVTLTRGMNGTFDMRENKFKEPSAFDENKIAWKTHRLRFQDVPLAAVVKTLEGYFDIEIETADTTLLTCRFKGVFEGVKLDEIAQVMNYSLNVKLTRVGSVYTLSGPGCNP